MVIIICRICGREWDDKRHDMLVSMKIPNPPRVCCDECVEEVFKRGYKYNLKEIKRIVLAKQKAIN